MNDSSGPVDLDKRIKAASTEAKELITKAFCEITGLIPKLADDRDKLFPNGVELIHVKVEAGLTEKAKMTIEVRIAGGNGNKGATAERVFVDEQSSANAR